MERWSEKNAKKKSNAALKNLGLKNSNEIREKYRKTGKYGVFFKERQCDTCRKVLQMAENVDRTYVRC